jgi:LPS export ABC transporter protein LptC
MGKKFPFICVLCGMLILPALVTCGRKPEKLSADDGLGAERLEQAEPAELGKFTQELRDIKYTQSKGGRKQWELKATGVQQVLDGPTELQHVTITYFEDDAETTTVTADAGSYDAATNNAELQGNVLVNTSDGAVVSTDALHWDQQTELLTGKGNVKITRQRSIIEGKGFQLSPEVETFTVFEVTGILRKGDTDS